MPSTDAVETLETQLEAPPASAAPAQPQVVAPASILPGPTEDPVTLADPLAPHPLQSSIPPEVMDESIEVMILTSSRPVPSLKLAVALGLVEPEAPIADSPAAADPPAEQAPAPSDVQPQPGPTIRPRRKAKGPKKADPEVLIAQSVARLNETYASTNRQFRIELVAGGYRLLTLPQHHALLARFHGLAAQTRLSKPAVETLAIIAYKQPVTRAQLEAIRGVACGEVLRSLLDRRLINIVGRAEELGRPMLYGTTRGFLELFGLSSLKDLPAPSDLNLAPAKL